MAAKNKKGKHKKINKMTLEELKQGLKHFKPGEHSLNKKYISDRISMYGNKEKSKKVNKMTLKELNNVLHRLQAVNDTSLYRKCVEDRINVTVSAEVNYAWPYYHKLSLQV